MRSPRQGSRRRFGRRASGDHRRPELELRELAGSDLGDTHRALAGRERGAHEVRPCRDLDLLVALRRGHELEARAVDDVDRLA